MGQGSKPRNERLSRKKGSSKVPNVASTAKWASESILPAHLTSWNVALMQNWMETEFLPPYMGSCHILILGGCIPGHTDGRAAVGQSWKQGRMSRDLFRWQPCPSVHHHLGILVTILHFKWWQCLLPHKVTYVISPIFIPGWIYKGQSGSNSNTHQYEDYMWSGTCLAHLRSSTSASCYNSASPIWQLSKSAQFSLDWAQ